jgi:hypothetical protein
MVEMLSIGAFEAQLSLIPLIVLINFLLAKFWSLRRIPNEDCREISP